MRQTHSETMAFPFCELWVEGNEWGGLWRKDVREGLGWFLLPLGWLTLGCPLGHRSFKVKSTEETRVRGSQ